MESNIKFGFRIHQSGYTFEELKRAVILADGLGYYSVTLYDLLGIPTLECWTTLSSLAGITKKIRLTPMVLANLYRPPLLLAKMGATLDVISNGRFELGIGAGGNRRDHELAGIEFPVHLPTGCRGPLFHKGVARENGGFGGTLGAVVHRNLD